MKRWGNVLALGLLVLAFGCEKDSLGGFGNEEAGLRAETGYVGPGVPAKKKILADYELVRVDEWPGEAGQGGFRPPAGAVPVLYEMKGEASLVGTLEPGLSYEAHYLPPDADLRKEIVDVVVWGQFRSGQGRDCLRYVGICTYYPDGRRASRYEFVNGGGQFEGAYGWISGNGQAWDGGDRMQFAAAGMVYFPPSDDIRPGAPRSAH
ncbi:MAG: hypothetical protein KDD10_18020 [Phaeodactylibacter sp.]|nr:hypothetical protein [Phaeodactylibacter sp.]MCB9296770.1 hypothetical protein [Lewinellaceae bacterium]